SAAAEIDALKRVYNRGDFTEGYLSTPLFAPKIVYDKIQNHIGVHAGQAVREGGRRFYVAGNFLPSDGFKLLYKGEEAGSAAITGNGGGKTHLEANTDAPFDELRLTLDARQSAGLLQSARDLRAPVHMRFILKAGVRSVIELSSRGIIARAEGAVPEKAANKPVDAAYVRESAEKCGELFVLERLELDTDGHAFMSRSALNALRRDGIDALADALWPVYAPKINTEAARQMPEYKNIRTLEQADLCIFSDLETYDVLREKFEIIVYAPEDYNTCAAPPGPFWLSLPPLALESDLEVLKQAVARLKPAGLYANNIYGVYFARELGLPLIAGYMLNIANAWGATALQMTDDRSQMTDKGHNEPNLSSVHFPLERGGGEAGGVWRHLSSENKALIIPSPEVDGSIRYAYGRFPLMTLAHCPEKNDCARCSGARTVLIDDKGKKLQVRRIKMSRCIFRLLDAEALELPARERAGRGLLFDFTGCGIQEITETLNRFAKHEERKNKNYFRKTV
ncbi:MAG: DUF3656 domain-containing protein, partial [Firmicutes bacterium]|nr:DUF3656 domain-containing protein [Bacillota bacterium]